VADIPADWSPHAQRYADFFRARLEAPRPFLEEALRARAQQL